MCECDATIRDLRQSLERAQEKVQTQSDEMAMMNGILQTLSFSMTMNSQARSLDEARWQDTSRWLAMQLARETTETNWNIGLLAQHWFTKALEATEVLQATERENGVQAE